MVRSGESFSFVCSIPKKVSYLYHLHPVPWSSIVIPRANSMLLWLLPSYLLSCLVCLCLFVCGREPSLLTRLAGTTVSRPIYLLGGFLYGKTNLTRYRLCDSHLGIILLSQKQVSRPYSRELAKLLCIVYSVLVGLGAFPTTLFATPVVLISFSDKLWLWLA